MFWNDPNLYGFTYKDINPTEARMFGTLPWQNVPRFGIPTGFGYTPTPYNIPTMPFNPYFQATTQHPFLQTPINPFLGQTPVNPFLQTPVNPFLQTPPVNPFLATTPINPWINPFLAQTAVHPFQTPYNVNPPLYGWKPFTC